MPFRYLLYPAIALAAVLASCSSGSSSNYDEWPSTDVIEVSTNTPSNTSSITGDKVTIINLWALWCAPCREELPRLQEVSTTNAGKLDVVGINIGDDFDKTASYIADAGLTFPMYWDETGDLLTALKIPSVPATLAIDDNGKIIWSHLGALSQSELNAKVNDLVSHSAP
jgi:thiol-disulfide isomerase/thioredoxin